MVNTIVSLTAVLAAAVLLTARPASAYEGGPHKPGAKLLSGSDMSGIRAEYERHRQAAFPVAGGHRARNYGQQWVTRFDGRGFEVTPGAGGWHWGLELRSYGFPGQEHGVKHSRAIANVEKLSYQWDSTMTEWFVNGSDGLEHGFTLASRPGNSDSALALHLAVRGTLTPRISPDGRRVSFLDGRGTPALNYAGLKVTDAGGRELAARFTREPQGLRLEVEERGARYPITIDPLAQQAYLKPAAVGTTQAGDFFGYSVGVSGDTVVVGAPQEDSASLGVNSTPDELAAGSSGAAYVFVRIAGAWSQQAYLKPAAVGPGGQAGDHMGWSVAISGDTVVVGAPDEDSATTGVNSTPAEGASNSGAAYVFTRTAGVWSQQAYLKPAVVGTTQAGSGDEFGYSVAVSGDTLVVGAYDEPSSSTGINSARNELAPGSGAAYVFTRTAGTWSQQAYLKPAAVGTTQANDHFGNSVAVSGDTVVVGAFQEDSSSIGINSTPNELAGAAGAAYVFVRAGGVWTQEAYLKPAAVGNTQAGDHFGISVTVSGDTVVAGAYQEASSTTGINSTPNEAAGSSGAAYVFVRNAGVWSQQAYLKPAAMGTTHVGEGFGWSVALSGDALAVGADGEGSSTTGINSIPDRLANSAGAVYVFTRSAGLWSQLAYLKPAAVGSTQLNDQFGWAVAMSGDTVVVGAINEDSSTLGVNSTPNEASTDSGAAYTFIVPVPVTITVNTSPFGLLFNSSGSGCAPGSSYTAPQLLAWTSGSSCTLSVSTPQGAYTFTQWEDGSTNPVRAVTAPAVNTTYTAIFIGSPVLSVAKAHTGSFIQGQTNAAYTVTVRNAAGAVSTNGSVVTMAEFPPSGLTLVSMSGTGWTCPAGGTSCTRSDVLLPGASFPAITVSVNVSAAAPAQVTNQVTVSGGGSAGASGSDVTNITANVFSISGTLTLSGGPLSGELVRIAGTQSGSTVTDGSGNYSFGNLTAGGTFTVTPDRFLHDYTPPSTTFSNLNANQTANFTAAVVVTNLALGKPTTQSSTFQAGSKAVDGGTNGDLSNGSVSHTYLDANAWWQVDLGSPAPIASIVIWNRTDCCGSRLSDYWVFVSNTPFLASDTPATLLGRAGTWSSHQTAAPGPSATIARGGTTGQYVRVQLSGTDYLSLAEVQVFGIPLPNLALGKTASQSSTYRPASAAVDGNTDGNLANNSVSHTYSDANAWWQADLGAPAAIASIGIWNRTDCCASRLTDYWVFVSDNPFSAADTPATLQNRAGTWSSHQTSAPNSSAAIPVGAEGRFVRVQLSGTDYLNLAEVQVFGTPLPNLALGKTASQSSTYRPASAAVDGNTDGNLGNNSVAHTYLDANAWWQVDLGAQLDIGSITIWNRTDCCGGRLSDYWVFVSATPFGAADTPATLQNTVWSSHQTSAPNSSAVIPVARQARYVRVQLSGTDYLSLAEVQVFGPVPNLAVGKTASQSSTFQTAAAAVDGNTDGNFANNSVSHTYSDANAWWQVDLGSQSAVSAISIWNRTDCCGGRLSDYWVFLSPTPFSASDTPAILQNRAGVWSAHQTSAPGPSATFAIGGAVGQYVRVQLSGTDYLNLAEVQVYGKALSILSQGKTASQSSSFRAASLAVDGNTDGNLANGSVSHTYLDSNAWWQVDLGASATVSAVTLWNRTDCCGSRLGDYWVFVSNTPFSASDTPVTLQNRAGTWSTHQISAPNPSVILATGGQPGRYVRVQLSGADYLQLAEVQVLGAP